MKEIVFVAFYFWWVVTFCRALGFMYDQKFVNTNSIRGIFWRVRSQVIVAEYDQWIGCYIDRKTQTSYWFPIPFIGIKFSLVQKAGTK